MINQWIWGNLIFIQTHTSANLTYPAINTSILPCMIKYLPMNLTKACLGYGTVTWAFDSKYSQCCWCYMFFMSFTKDVWFTFGIIWPTNCNYWDMRQRCFQAISPSKAVGPLWFPLVPPQQSTDHSDPSSHSGSYGILLVKPQLLDGDLETTPAAARRLMRTKNHKAAKSYVRIHHNWKVISHHSQYTYIIYIYTYIYLFSHLCLLLFIYLNLLFNMYICPPTGN
jgi:hypothetical protein